MGSGIPSDRPFPSMMAPPKQKKVSMRLCPERSPHNKGGVELDSCPSLELSSAVICGATGDQIVVTLQHSKLQVDCRPTLRAVSPPREGPGTPRINQPWSGLSSAVQEPLMMIRRRSPDVQTLGVVETKRLSAMIVCLLSTWAGDGFETKSRNAVRARAENPVRSLTNPGWPVCN